MPAPTSFRASPPRAGPAPGRDARRGRRPRRRAPSPRAPQRVEARVAVGQLHPPHVLVDVQQHGVVDDAAARRDDEHVLALLDGAAGEVAAGQHVDQPVGVGAGDLHRPLDADVPQRDALVERPVLVRDVVVLGRQVHLVVDVVRLAAGADRRFEVRRAPVPGAEIELRRCGHAVHEYLRVEQRILTDSSVRIASVPEAVAAEREARDDQNQAHAGERARVEARERQRGAAVSDRRECRAAAGRNGAVLVLCWGAAHWCALRVVGPDRRARVQLGAPVAYRPWGLASPDALGLPEVSTSCDAAVVSAAGGREPFPPSWWTPQGYGCSGLCDTPRRLSARAIPPSFNDTEREP